MNKITQKKLNLDLVLKDIEKYCYSELSYDKIQNLKYINNYFADSFSTEKITITIDNFAQDYI